MSRRLNPTDLIDKCNLYNFRINKLKWMHDRHVIKITFLVLPFLFIFWYYGIKFSNNFIQLSQKNNILMNIVLTLISSKKWFWIICILLDINQHSNTDAIWLQNVLCQRNFKNNYKPYSYQTRNNFSPLSILQDLLKELCNKFEAAATTNHQVCIGL